MFHSAEQEYNETVDEYILRLRKLADSCDFKVLHDEMIIQINCKKQKPYKRVMWNFKGANFDINRDRLNEVDWQSCILGDLDSSVKSVTNTFMTIAKEIVPNKLVTIRPHDKSWYCSALRAMRRRMVLMYRKYKCRDGESKIQAFVNYSKQRNTYFSAIKDAKANYQNTQFEKI